MNTKEYAKEFEGLIKNIGLSRESIEEILTRYKFPDLELEHAHMFLRILWQEQER